MKKIIAAFICVLMTAAVAVTALTAFAAVKVGDINKDGELNNKDVVLLFRYVSGSEKADDESIYDFNGDKNVDNKDVVMLFRTVSAGAQSDDTEEEPDDTADESSDAEPAPVDSESDPVDSGSEEIPDSEEVSDPDTDPDTDIDSEEPIVVPDKTITYVASDVYADTVTAEKEGFTKATDANVCDWFGGKRDMDMETFELIYILPEAFDYVDGFVFHKAKGQYIEEVTVFKVKEGGSIDAVVQMADARREKQKNNADYTLYDDDDHRNAKMLDKGVVEAIGDFVVYIVTEDVDTSVLRAKKYVLDNPDCSVSELYKAIVIELYSE